MAQLAAISNEPFATNSITSLVDTELFTAVTLYVKPSRVERTCNKKIDRY